ncbi:hypothetical protein DFQ27_005191 [Actinomortierella ambigua]|uniref:Uncharacterized protein n=1 Tax=Actinomortierella ambigua TaxID=1343610 RepID=A0A9P6U395_9FUNG|nr:hypothetical protein DFQ27_005191 [Actinomortierella ambigua]
MKSSTALVAAAALTIVAAQSAPANPAQNWCNVYIANCKTQSNETCGGTDGQFNSYGDCNVGFSGTGICASYQIVCHCSAYNGPKKDIAIPVLRKTFDATNGTCKNLGEGTNVTSPVTPSTTATVTAVPSTPATTTTGSANPSTTSHGSDASTTLLSLTAVSAISAILSALFL